LPISTRFENAGIAIEYDWDADAKTYQDASQNTVSVFKRKT